MNKLHLVLGMLRPEGGWVVWGDDFDGIRWDEGITPITKKELDDGFAKYDAWAAEQNINKDAAKAALLAQLGITEEQAKLLLS